MLTQTTRPKARCGGYAGLRLTADEYLALPEDGKQYELVDGVVVMSPSATPRHQLVALSILKQLVNHADERGLGLVLYETDVRLPVGAGRRDVVYRPEIIFLLAARASQVRSRIEIAPDVVVEVVSPDSRSLDTETKFTDYERAGVQEYWLIDPEKDSINFYRLTDAHFVEVPPTGEFYDSAVVPGFRLDLRVVRAAFSRL